MTQFAITRARDQLGQAYGLGRPLHAAELGRLLGCERRDPGASVLDWENGKRAISGAVAVAIGALLAGYRPPGFYQVIPPMKGVADA